MDTLTPTEKLSERVSVSVDAAGISRYGLANRTGLARTTLRRKLDGHAEWTISELTILASVIADALNTSAPALVVAWLDGIFDQVAA